MQNAGNCVDNEAVRLVFLMAPSLQGDGKISSEVAKFLGIELPLTMAGLSNAARARGFRPAELWPWLFPSKAWM